MVPILLLVIAQVTSSQVPEDPAFREGVRLLEDFEYEKAAFRFREALRDDDRPAEEQAVVYVYLGMTLSELREEAAATEAFANALKEDPDVVLPAEASPKVKDLMSQVRSQKASAPPPAPPAVVDEDPVDTTGAAAAPPSSGKLEVAIDDAASGGGKDSGALIAAGTTLGVGLVAAVPTAAFCGFCTCCALPAPLVCGPASTGLGAAIGLLVAGVDLSEAWLPVLLASGAGCAGGLVAVGAGLGWALLSGTARDVALNNGIDPSLAQNAGAVNQLVYGGIVLGVMSLGAAAAGGIVYVMADPEGDDVDVEQSTRVKAAATLPPVVRVADAMAF